MMDDAEDTETTSYEADDTVEEEKVSDDKESDQPENDSGSKDDDSDCESGSDELSDSPNDYKKV